MKHVFLSSVSQEYGLKRPEIKQLFAQRGIELSIQEDFADRASPHGTLLKIYMFLSQADMTVHVIGSHQPHPVPQEEFDELFAVLPQFRDWLAKKAILPAVEAGQVGYTHFEVYMALYLRAPVVIVRWGRGAQRDHENRLQRLGRHVNGNAMSLEDMLVVTDRALEDEVWLDRRSHLRLAAKQSRLRSLARGAFFVFALLSAAVIHLSVFAEAASQSSLLILHALASFLVLITGHVGMHMAFMTDALTLSFRFRTALRNAVVWLLLAVSAGWVLSDWVSYWLVLIVSIVLFGAAVRASEKDLEEEMENWRRRDRKLKIRVDGWYWCERREVLAALRVADFESMPKGEQSR